MKLSKLIEELDEVRDFLRGSGADPEISFFNHEGGVPLPIHRVVVHTGSLLGDGVDTGAYLSSYPRTTQDEKREKTMKERNAEIERLLTRKGFKLIPPGPHRNNEGIRVRYGRVIVDFDSRGRRRSTGAQIQEVLTESGMLNVRVVAD